MNSLTYFEDIKSNFITLYNDNIIGLSNYLKENNISLKEWREEWQKDKKDILIYAIEHKASYEIINYIIQYGQYETLNYTFYDNKEHYSHYETIHGTFGGYSDYKTPLFIAVLNNNFKIADLLIKNKADINYFTRFENIVDFLYNLNFLNIQNLKYILSRGIKAEYFLIHIPSFINDFENDFLNIIFRNYIFDNAFILNILNIYKSKETLSQKQLQEIIKKEKNKIYIHDFAYKNAIENENFEGIMILLENDGRDEETLFDIISNYKILEKAVERNNSKLFQFLRCNKKFYI
ncbi:hypothetical protein BCR32DRAFT_281095 [Anaeromyces robustus]|uniref:Uncharacterized protein n=1 Tax=Anaeromyces robustus TaxID=1754192 RepID=A0A1Y1X372_9FUNG|nr:hypothetical protein BCR32DRAFT_281095 [Anaeromyces robustus]|eukprot:ORX79774.1 hypothetical protein BCR32DRAFT_281095 [Anaeromyces robustus]